MHFTLQTSGLDERQKCLQVCDQFLHLFSHLPPQNRTNRILALDILNISRSSLGGGGGKKFPGVGDNVFRYFNYDELISPHGNSSCVLHLFHAFQMGSHGHPGQSTIHPKRSPAGPRTCPLPIFRTDLFVVTTYLTCHGTVAVGSLWPGVPLGSCWPQHGEGELTLWLNMSVSCRSCVYWHRCCRIISTLSTSSRSSSCTGGKDQRPLSMSPQLGDLLTRQV